MYYISNIHNFISIIDKNESFQNLNLNLTKFNFKVIKIILVLIIDIFTNKLQYIKFFHFLTY